MIMKLSVNISVTFSVTILVKILLKNASSLVELSRAESCTVSTEGLPIREKFLRKQ